VNGIRRTIAVARAPRNTLTVGAATPLASSPSKRSTVTTPVPSGSSASRSLSLNGEVTVSQPRTTPLVPNDRISRVC